MNSALRTVVCLSMTLLPYVVTYGQDEDARQTDSTPADSTRADFTISDTTFLDTTISGSTISGSTAGQESISVEILENSVVTSFRERLPIRETPAEISLVEAYQMRRQNSITLAHVMRDEPGLSMGGDGVWSSSIYIHGLGGSRIVSAVDGCRIEAPSDLAASLSMFDIHDIERVEVVKGANSSLYGSGAMGGIVNVITKKGHFSDAFRLGGGIAAGYSSVNNYYNPHISIDAGSLRWWARVSSSYGNAGDSRTPKGVLPNSGFKSCDLDVKAGIKLADNQTLEFIFQRNASRDVGIPGGAAFSEQAEASFDDITRTLASAEYSITNLSQVINNLKLHAYWQDIEESVEMIPNMCVSTDLPTGLRQVTAPQLISPDGGHRTVGLQAETNLLAGERNSIVTGLDFWRRDICSDRIKYIDMDIYSPSGAKVMSKKVERGETPLPDASFTSCGVFVQDRFTSEYLTLMLGGRIDGIFVENEECYDYDYIIIDGELQPLTSRRVTFEEGRSAELSWSANAGAILKVGARTDLVFNFARSYRAASLEERFKYIDLTSKVQLGNPDLKPEKGYSADVGIRCWGNRFQFQASVYINHLKDMISEVEGTFYYHLATDDVTRTLPALVYDNIDEALLYGADFKAEYSFNRVLKAFAGGSYVRGRDLSGGGSLRSIPPAEASIGLIWSDERRGGARIAILGAGARSEGDIAPLEKATDGYYRIDIALNSPQFHLGETTLQLFGGVDNLTDVAYTNFLSTNRCDVNFEPGRNIFIKAFFSF